MFSSALYIHDALKRLVTEQRRRASVDTHAARREYDSKQRSGASFIKSQRHNDEINVFKRFSGFTRIEVSHSVRSRAWSVRRQARFSHQRRAL